MEPVAASINMPMPNVEASWQKTLRALTVVSAIELFCAGYCAFAELGRFGPAATVGGRGTSKR